MVQTTRVVHRVVLKWPGGADASNDDDDVVADSVISRFGSCSCGFPAWDHFPSAHTVAVADHLKLDESEVMAKAYSLAMWRNQYRTSIKFHALTRE